jgi:hypothetical protein
VILTIAIGELSSWGLAWLFALAAAPFVSAPFTVLVGQFVFERNPSVGAALKDALVAVPRILMVTFLVGMGLLASGIILFLPAIWVGTTSFFVFEAVLLERASIGQAFTRSSRLSSRAGGEVLMAWMVVTLFLFVGPLLAHEIGSIALEHVLTIRVPQRLFEDGSSPLAAIGFWLVLPYVTIVRFLFYVNVRTRAEGWDIQTAFATIAAQAEDVEDAERNEARA